MHRVMVQFIGFHFVGRGFGSGGTPFSTPGLEPLKQVTHYLTDKTCLGDDRVGVPYVTD